MTRWSLVFLLMMSICAHAADLGIAYFPTSGKPEAQTAFLEGVLWLHSFEYESARAQFQEAQKLDPDFAMAYWGEAMTHDHPIWAQQDRAQARDVLQRLGATPEARAAKAPTGREKDYLRSVEILYGEGDRKTRYTGYVDFMRRMRERYPEDLEAASFYSLALLGACQGQRDIGMYMKAAAVAEEVFAKNPRHPGAAHYLIHSYDDPIHAPLGLRAARAYAKIAPAATHALHMPSHIFVALGMWDDVVASNVDSWQASHQHSYHAMHWLEYGYLQQGRFGDARKLLSQIENDVRTSGKLQARRHLAAMRAAYIVETRRWTDEAASIRVDTSDFQDDLSLLGADLFVSGMAAVKAGNIEAARRTLAEMQQKIPARKKEVLGMKEPPARSPSEIAAAEIAQAQLEGLLLFAEGKRDEALQKMERAAEMEDALSFDFGPPVPVKPVRELLGELLLEAGRPADARGQFERALQRAPGRSLALEGLSQAAAESGDAEAAAAAKARLQSNHHSADK